MENLTFNLDTFNLTKKAHLWKGLNNSELIDAGLVNFLGKLVEKSKYSQLKLAQGNINMV